MSEKKETQGVPFYPNHITLEAKVALGFGIALIGIGVIGLFFPVGLQEPADPLDTPAHIKPEWYFLFLYQILKFIPKNIGATAPVIGLVLIALWPFLDRKKDQSKRAARTRLIISCAIVLIVIVLTIWGEVS